MLNGIQGLSQPPGIHRLPGGLAFLFICSLFCTVSCAQYGYHLLPNTPRSLLAGTTAVSVRSAWLLTASAHVCATVANDGRRPLVVDCREWALRGPDGTSFPPRPDGPCWSQPAKTLMPGQSQELVLEFPITGTDGLEWSTLELVVGGVRELPDGTPQVVGTVPFARAGGRERFDDPKSGH
jgi:hypothetical protein